METILNSEIESDDDQFDDDIDISEDDSKPPTVNQLRPPTEEERKIWQLDKRWSLFMNPRMHGLCFNPWQFLKVDIFAKTNVCCTYFGRLPKFEFVSARDFHGEKGMWNHPFMQHMRSQNGKKDEVPYCGFCQGRYRKDLPGRTARRLAIVESQKLLQDKMDEVLAFKYTGIIDSLDEDLSTWDFPLKRKDGYLWRPFRSRKQFYRRDIRLAEFQNIGQVALFGSSLSAYAPFLAESNKSLQIVDWQPKQMNNVKELLDTLELDNGEFVLIEDGTKLPFSDASLDGVWLDARRWLERFPRKILFDEIKRVLKPEGRLRAVCAPGPGDIILKAIHASDNMTASLLADTLKNEEQHSKMNTFYTIEKLYKTLKKAGFTLSKERPPQIKTIGKAFREKPMLGRDLNSIAERLLSAQFRKELRDDSGKLDGLEQSICFNAHKTPARKKHAEIPVQVIRKGDVSIEEFRFTDTDR